LSPLDRQRPSGASSRGNTFPRARRLKRQRFIRALFDRSRDDVRTVRAGALVVRYRIVPAAEADISSPLQVGFATGRHLRTKPVRNRIKRVMREVVRTHQHALVDLFADRPDTLTLMILYRGGRPGAEDAVTRDLPRLLDQVAHEISSEPHTGT
jgi:ribonuclease P protein component